MNVSSTRTIFVSLLLFIVTFVGGCSQEGDQIQVKAIKGQPAPIFTLTDLKGADWQLADLQGKVVFINFWATWCPPCIKELPSMNALLQNMDGKAFQMLTILYNDRPEFAQSMVNKAGYDFTVLIDPDSSVGRQYGLTGVPETFIIDQQGILREKFIGPFDWNSPAALQIIEQYLPPK